MRREGTLLPRIDRQIDQQDSEQHGIIKNKNGKNGQQQTMMMPHKIRSCNDFVEAKMSSIDEVCVSPQFKKVAGVEVCMTAEKLHLVKHFAPHALPESHVNVANVVTTLIIAFCTIPAKLDLDFCCLNILHKTKGPA